MDQIIRLFLTKSRLNYTLFFILLVFGIVSYITIPKDVFPKIKIDKVIVSGYYSGASVNILDKIIVTSLEKNLKSINGVGKIESFINNDNFSIILTLESSVNKIDILNKTKDVISNHKSDLPKDMDEPTASLINWSMPLIDVTVSSDNLNHVELIHKAKIIKDRIAILKNISNIRLYEDTTNVFEIVLDTNKIELYELNKELLFDAIKKLSYIYPLGIIKDKKEHLYLSTNNGKKHVNEYLNTVLKIDDKTIYLGDIAKVKKGFKEVDVISKLNGKKNIIIGISKNDKANAIELASQIRKKVAALDKEFKDVNIGTSFDNSVYITKRLNTVVSGIMFGLILVALAIYLLINKRVAFIVVLGIPTAILFGIILLYLANYSINMMTLIGVLLVLGILVDDAVIIAENIQRHIVLGENKLEATINGTKEVLTPVLAASLTTIFAFFPMMMLSGELGEFLKIIPAAIVVLIIASVIESFVFLPIHSLHILKKGDKELDWSKAQNIYSKFLHKIIKHKIKFLIFFVLIIPLFSYVLFSNMKYQMMPEVDTNLVFIQGKFKKNFTVEQTYNSAKVIEEILLKHKNELSIKTISFSSGLAFNNEGNMDIKPSLFQFNIELHERVYDDFVNKYITPSLSLNALDIQELRTKNTHETIQNIKALLKDYKPKELIEFNIKKENSGITENGIEILVSAKNDIQMMQVVNNIKKELKKNKGIISIQDTAKDGNKELKLKLNSYGESLGFNESSLGFTLNPLFLEAEQTKGLSEKGLFEILTFDEKKDSFETLKNLELSIPNTNQKIALSEICDFIFISNFDTISKTNQNKYQMVSANVNNKITTAHEALKKLEGIFSKYKKEGVIINLEGEEEQNATMLKEMTYALLISMSLIFITLLLMFNSFKQTFMILSIIPFSILGAIIGHLIMGMNLSMPSLIGLLGLAGVVINDAIVMLDFIRKSKNLEEMMKKSVLRLRPIIITSITTFLGLSTLIFFAAGQAKILQPIAISLGFGLLWGTILTLFYLPALFAVLNKFKREKA